VVAAEFVTDFGDRKGSWLDKCLAVRDFWADIRDTLDEYPDEPHRIIIEDVYPFAAQPKWVYRIQGYLTWLMENDGYSYEWCLPLKWQRYFGYKKIKGRTTKSWAKEIAAEKGYVPQAKGKARIDLQDAFLIAQWAKENSDASEGAEAARTEQVEVAE
jgi:hypothetical protein